MKKVKSVGKVKIKTLKSLALQNRKWSQVLKQIVKAIYIQISRTRIAKVRKSILRQIMLILNKIQIIILVKEEVPKSSKIR